MHHPPLTDAEITELIPLLQAIAGKVGRSFPRWRMSNEDLVQTAFLNILQVLPRAEETADDLRYRRLNAGEHGMIDALRKFHDLRWERSRKMEALMPDFEHLADHILVQEGFEDALIETIDLRRKWQQLSHLIQRFPTREQFLIRERLKGRPLAEVGKQINLTEGRMSQIEKHLVTTLRHWLEPLSTARHPSPLFSKPTMYADRTHAHILSEIGLVNEGEPDFRRAGKRSLARPLLRYCDRE